MAELWKDLSSKFSLDTNHKGENVALEIKGETVLILPEAGNVYRTGKMSVLK